MNYNELCARAPTLTLLFVSNLRHRAKVVEYRVSQHKKVLGKRLAAVRKAPPFVTTRKPVL